MIFSLKEKKQKKIIIADSSNSPLFSQIFSMAKKCAGYRAKKDSSEIEEILSRIPGEDIEILVNSESKEEIDRIIARYSW